MASDSDPQTLPTNGQEMASIEQALTPSDPGAPPLQMSLVEVPASPIDDANASIKAESQDGRVASPAIVPSSLTPPPHPSDNVAASTIDPNNTTNNTASNALSNDQSHAPSSTTASMTTTTATTTTTTNTTATNTSIAAGTTTVGTASTPTAAAITPTPTAAAAAPPPPPPAGPHASINTSFTANSIPQPLFSPPATVPNGNIRRHMASAMPYMMPTLAQTHNASAEDLRNMLHIAVEEIGRSRGELAGWRFRANQLSRNEEEYAERHHVELDMMHREIEALCEAERVRIASQPPAISRTLQADYDTLSELHRQLQADYKIVQLKFRAAKRIIQEKDEANAILQDDKDMLLNRLRENREHAQQLLSPGKILHPTPPSKGHAHHHSMSTPQTTGRSAHRETPRSHLQTQSGVAALINVLQQEDDSIPATPMAHNAHHNHHKQSSRSGHKGHTRNVQSMSAIPTTPQGPPRGEHAGLLPSVNLVPRTEPRRYNNLFKAVNAPQPPPLPPISSPHPPPPQPASSSARAGTSAPPHRASSTVKSRESTISADEDNAQELARQALQQFHRNVHQAEEESRYDAAVAAAPAAAEKTVRMHAKLFGQGEKRKHHDDGASAQPRRGLPTSPKRVKLPGLGIREGR